MKKYLAYILIVIILVGIFSPTFVSAQSASDCIPLWFDFAGCATYALLWLLFAILSLVSLFLMFSGMILDFVLNYTIVDMRLRIDGLSGINTAWKILKDLMNIVFIFLLLYEAIKLIIGQGSKESVKKFITGIVLASILINFSLFFTKVLIDASNIVTVGLYDATIINSEPLVVGPSTGTSIIGLSTPIMRAVGLTSFFSTGTFESMTSAAGGQLNMLAIPILALVLFSVVIFVFFAMSMMLIIRFLTLILLLILSPIAYMGLALNFMKPYSSQWWKAFNSQLLFPPILMLMMLIVITLVSSPGFIISGNWGNVIPTGSDPESINQSAQGFIDLIFKFIMVIGLTISALVISKKVSNDGSSHISNATAKLTGFAGSAVMGGAGRFGRATVGRAANNAANDDDLKARAIMERKGFIDKTKGAWARTVLKTSDKLAGKSFDVRGTSSFESLAKTSGFGGDFGKPDKNDNFRDKLKEQAEKAEKNAKLYKPSEAHYAKAKEIDTRTKLAETQINSENFIKVEDGRWRETEEGKLATQHETELNEAIASATSSKKESLEKFQENNKKIKELQKKLDWTESAEEKSKIELEMNRLGEETKAKETAVVEMGKIVDQRKALFETSKASRTKFESQEMIGLKNMAKLGSDNEAKLNEQYKARVDGLADLQESSNVAWRVTANTLGTFTNVLGLTAQPRSRVERETIARKIKGVYQEKSKKEKAEQATREYMEENEKKKEDEKKGGGDMPKKETPPTQVPVPTPAP